MKLSELQALLKEYQDKYGDIEIKFYKQVEQREYSATIEDFGAVSHDDNNPRTISYITIWD